MRFVFPTNGERETILDAARSGVWRAPSSSPRPRFRWRRWRLTHRPFGRCACLRAARQSPVAADRMHCKINVGPAHYSSSSSVTCHFHSFTVFSVRVVKLEFLCPRPLFCYASSLGQTEANSPWDIRTWNILFTPPLAAVTAVAAAAAARSLSRPPCRCRRRLRLRRRHRRRECCGAGARFACG